MHVYQNLQNWLWLTMSLLEVLGSLPHQRLLLGMSLQASAWHSNNALLLLLAGISNSWLRMFDLMERMRNNLEKDHSLVRRFTGGVVHQVIFCPQNYAPRCHTVSTRTC